MEKTNIQRGALSWKLILEAVPKRCLTQLKVKLFPWAEKKKAIMPHNLNLMMKDHRIPFVRWSLHKYKCL